MQLHTYREQGYLIIRQAFSVERVRALRQAVQDLVKRADDGEVEISWIDREKGLPARTGHLLNPDKYNPAFGHWLAEDLVQQLDILLGGHGRHSLFGLLAGGGGEAYKQAWHRDLGKPGAEDEAEFLQRTHGRLVQFNAPLIEADHFLQIVPGSHLRASTASEIEASQAGVDATMQDAMTVELEPGDIVYYNANLWHRGWNPTGNTRWTMHCAFWQAEFPVMKHEHGQREVLMTPGHLERMPDLAALYIRRYLEQYGEGDPPDLRDL